jgi:uncharacterized membrane protein
MPLVYKCIILVALIVFVFGFLMPSLVSSNSTAMVMVGFVLGGWFIGVLINLIWKYINELS